MDMVNKILNVTVPPLVFLSLFLSSPLLVFFKVFRYVQRRINPAEDVAGKVILITGASSGIGEELAYEYARRGARLTLVGRREDRLRAVAEKSRRLGSPDVLFVSGDVSIVEECRCFMDETINHFGQLDHLVNNAGITELKAFEDYSCISDAARVMNTNFWGSVYATHFAIPHLKRNKGKIVAISSGVSGWFSPPRMSVYGATKAAVINFYETLRIELGPEIGITIVTPGAIRTEMTTPQLVVEEGWGFVPLLSARSCARGIVDGVCRGERCVAEPSWVTIGFWLKTFCPEFLDWLLGLRMKRRPKHD